MHDILHHPQIKKFSKELYDSRQLPFDEIYGDEDYLKTFRETPFERLKVIYIKQVNDSPEQQFREMELDLFKGLNANLVAQDNLCWLHEQGVMVLPRKFTWGTPKPLHEKWKWITDELLRRVIKQKWVMVCTNDPEIVKLVESINNSIPIIGQGPGCWTKIKLFIENELNEKIEWDPWSCGKEYRH